MNLFPRVGPLGEDDEPTPWTHAYGQRRFSAAAPLLWFVLAPRRSGRLGAQGTAPDHAVDFSGHTLQRLAGISPAADGPLGLAQPQRGVAVRQRLRGPDAAFRPEPRRERPRPVPH